MRISHCLAAGLGLALLSSASAAAAPQRARQRVVATHPALDHARALSKVRSADRAGARGAARDALNDRVLDRMLVIQQKALERLANAASKMASKTVSRPLAEHGATPMLAARVWELRRKGNDVGPLRQELSEIAEQLWGTAAPDVALRPQPQSPTVVEPERVTLKLPDVGELGAFDPQLPVNPATASAPAFIDARSPERSGSNASVAEAIGYLIATATPGSTMVRQGTALAISRLHPAFCIKLAEAVRRARAAGLAEAGVASAYRPPAFGVGGFVDKFDSLHSYGLAADMTGIGGAGSASAHLWQAIVDEVGLYLVYGADNRAEFNHTQLVPDKKAPLDLRATITPAAPKDLREMWLASGVDDHVNDVTAAAALQVAASAPNGDEIAPPPAATDVAEAPRRTALVWHRVAEHGSKLSKRSKETKLSKLPKVSRHAGHGAAAHTRVSAAPQHAGSRRKAG